MDQVTLALPTYCARVTNGLQALTLIGDGFKGWLAVWLALRFGPPHGVTDTGVALVAVAVVLGHLYPIFLRFRGGKGLRLQRA